MNKKKVVLKIDGQSIAGQLYFPGDIQKKYALLFLHGWTGRPNEEAASYMAQNGYCAMTIAMRGHSGSGGDIRNITAQNSLDDAIAAYDYLIANTPENTGVVAVGNSYGSYIAALLSGQRDLVALSLRVPAAYPDELYDLPKWGRGNDDSSVDKWRHQVVHFSSNKAFSLINAFDGDIQIIEGKNDDVIPRQTVENYKSAVKDEKKLSYHNMPGWSHSIGNNEIIANEFKILLLNWLSKLKS